MTPKVYRFTPPVARMCGSEAAAAVQMQTLALDLRVKSCMKQVAFCKDSLTPGDLR